MKSLTVVVVRVKWIVAIADCLVQTLFFVDLDLQHPLHFQRENGFHLGVKIAFTALIHMIVGLLKAFHWKTLTLNHLLFRETPLLNVTLNAIVVIMVVQTTLSVVTGGFVFVTNQFVLLFALLIVLF